MVMSLVWITIWNGMYEANAEGHVRRVTPAQGTAPNLVLKPYHYPRGNPDPRVCLYDGHGQKVQMYVSEIKRMYMERLAEISEAVVHGAANCSE